MATTIFFLLVCVCASTTMAYHVLPGCFVPKKLTDPSQQCRKHGYAAVCIPRSDAIHKMCRHLTCAVQPLLDGSGMWTKSPSIGPAENGAYCGNDDDGRPQMCYDGWCWSIPCDHEAKFPSISDGERCTIN